MPLTESANPSSLSRKHTVVPQSTAATGPCERVVNVNHISVSYEVVVLIPGQRLPLMLLGANWTECATTFPLPRFAVGVIPQILPFF